MQCGRTGMTGRLVRALLILRRVVLLCMWPFLARLMRSLVSRLSFLPLFHGTDPCHHQVRLMSSMQQTVNLGTVVLQRTSCITLHPKWQGELEAAHNISMQCTFNAWSGSHSNTRLKKDTKMEA